MTSFPGVRPRQEPERTRSAKADIRSSTACTSATTSCPSTTSFAARGQPQRGVQHGPVLGGVDVRAGEHCGDPVGPAGPRAARAVSSVQRLVGDQVLAVVDVQVGDVAGEPLTPLRAASNSSRRWVPRIASACLRRACHSSVVVTSTAIGSIFSFTTGRSAGVGAPAAGDSTSLPPGTGGRDGTRHRPRRGTTF